MYRLRVHATVGIEPIWQHSSCRVSVKDPKKYQGCVISEDLVSKGAVCRMAKSTSTSKGLECPICAFARTVYININSVTSRE